jgi:hypothetical protein
VAVLSLVVGALAFVFHPLRPDLPALPRWWTSFMAAAWFGGFLVPLAAALLPRRAQVLPDAARATSLALVSAVALILLELGCNVTAPGRTLFFADVKPFFRVGSGCVVFELELMCLPVLLALLALRRVLQTGAWRVGAALGAAGGALGGMYLQFLCPYGGRFHTAVMHGGGVLVCAAVGALAAHVAFRRR